MYYGEYSIQFFATAAAANSNEVGTNPGTPDTWKRWHLVPTSRPLFSSPKPKETTVDILGHHGIVYLKRDANAHPVYQNRTGSLEFVLHPDYAEEWPDIYREMASFFHGKDRACALRDDFGYYYTGRFTLRDEKPGGYWDTVTLDYSLDPFRRERNYAHDYAMVASKSTYPWTVRSNGENRLVPKKGSPIAIETNSSSWLQVPGLGLIHPVNGSIIRIKESEVLCPEFDAEMNIYPNSIILLKPDGTTAGPKYLGLNAQTSPLSAFHGSVELRTVAGQSVHYGTTESITLPEGTVLYAQNSDIIRIPEGTKMELSGREIITTTDDISARRPGVGDPGMYLSVTLKGPSTELQVPLPVSDDVTYLRFKVSTGGSAEVNVDGTWTAVGNAWTNDDRHTLMPGDIGTEIRNVRIKGTQDKELYIYARRGWL